MQFPSLKYLSLVPRRSFVRGQHIQDDGKRGQWSSGGVIMQACAIVVMYIYLRTPSALRSVSSFFWAIFFWAMFISSNSSIISSYAVSFRVP